MHNDARMAAKVLGSGADAQTATQAHPITDTSRDVFVACFSHYYSLLTPRTRIGCMHMPTACRTCRPNGDCSSVVCAFGGGLVVVMMRDESKVHQDA